MSGLSKVVLGPGARASEDFNALLLALQTMQQDGLEIEKQSIAVRSVYATTMAESAKNSIEDDAKNQIIEGATQIGSSVGGLALEHGGAYLANRQTKLNLEQTSAKLDNVNKFETAFKTDPEVRIGQEPDVELHDLRNPSPHQLNNAKQAKDLDYGTAELENYQERISLMHPDRDTAVKDAALERIASQKKTFNKEISRYQNSIDAIEGRFRSFGQVATNAASGSGKLLESFNTKDKAEQEKMKAIYEFLSSSQQTVQQMAQSGLVDDSRQRAAGVIQAFSSLYAANNARA